LGYPIIGFMLNLLTLKSMPKTIHSKDYLLVIERLKKARIESDLTQAQVADKLNKPQSFVSKAELGERRLDVMELKKFADIYEKDINFFIK